MPIITHKWIAAMQGTTDLLMCTTLSCTDFMHSFGKVLLLSWTLVFSLMCECEREREIEEGIIKLLHCFWGSSFSLSVCNQCLFVWVYIELLSWHENSWVYTNLPQPWSLGHNNLPCGSKEVVWEGPHQWLESLESSVWCRPLGHIWQIIAVWYTKSFFFL